jgi:hypothetical protein
MRWILSWRVGLGSGLGLSIDTGNCGGDGGGDGNGDICGDGLGDCGGDGGRLGYKLGGLGVSGIGLSMSALQLIIDSISEGDIGGLCGGVVVVLQLFSGGLEDVGTLEVEDVGTLEDRE